MSGFTGGSSGGGGGGLTAPQMPYFYVSGFFGSNVALTGVQSPTSGTATNGQVVLVANNSSQVQNGLYIVNTGGAWSRDPSYTVALIPVAKVVCDIPNGRYDEFLADPPSGYAIGVNSLPYSSPYSSDYSGTVGSSLRVRGAGASGSASVDFNASGNGVYPPGTPDTQIIRASGANGSLDITNNGLGNLNLNNSGGPINVAPGGGQNLNLHTAATIGTTSIGSSGSTLNTTPRISLGGSCSSDTGVAVPPNKITAAGSSSPTARQLQIFFDGASTLANYTATLPASTALIDGQELLVHSGAFGVTALTLTAGAGTTIRAAITTLAADSFARYKYIAANAMWVRIG